jgi:uncharacterized protein (TIGR02145 family)
MKKNNLILGTFLAITAILFSSCGASPSSDSTSTEKVEGSAESTESGGVVTIGTQVWTSTNLDVSTFRNGDPIPQAKTDAEWKGAGENKQPAWCYYDNDPSNGTKYGKLYNWYSVNDPRGLAPKGYHIPTDAEWTKLSHYLGGSGAGTKMKSTSGWVNDGNGNNSSGFSGLPGGCRYSNGSFNNSDGLLGVWWSSSEDNTSFAWCCDLVCESGDVDRGINLKVGGLSVRCLRD